ncbi:MAG: nicotinate-nicotinamide nucleotide adenylyltransferase [SAR324 cluster bacterium]|nr:nicotinate-nicotinamide nucleotide adenylyltransferase [SAR324 cluster bacterium]
METRTRPRFIVFGGTFNPIHLGHMGLVEGLLRRGGVDHLFVVPTRQNPFKLEQEPLPGALRWEMVCRALRGIPRVSVLDLEMRREHPAYSVETLAVLGSIYPGAVFRLAMGWDVYQEFGTWRKAERILELAELVVVRRSGSGGVGATEAGEWLEGLPPPWRDRVSLTEEGHLVSQTGRTVAQFVDLDLPEISASRIREERALKWVPEASRGLLAAHWEALGKAGS